MPTERGLLSAHGCGKGDKERSSKWRANYAEVNWTGVTGFVRDGARFVKRYGTAPIFATLICPIHGAVSLTQSQFDTQLYDGTVEFHCPE